MIDYPKKNVSQWNVTVAVPTCFVPGGWVSAAINCDRNGVSSRSDYFPLGSEGGGGQGVVWFKGLTQLFSLASTVEARIFCTYIGGRDCGGLVLKKMWDQALTKET